MSFHWKEFEDVAIDDLISTIIDELVDSGGWVEFDSGYNVVRDPNSEIAIYISLEATNKRFLQLEVGKYAMWNTSTHDWDGTDYLEMGHLLADGTGAASGTAEGTVKMSYDDSYVWIITDYTAVSADYRRCASFSGLATPLDSTDKCLTYGSSLFDGTNASPANTSGSPFRVNIIQDISGSVAGYLYHATFIAPDGTNNPIENGAPRMCILSATVDKRLMSFLYLSSNSEYGEAAGIRCSVPSVFIGGSKDAEPYGATIRTTDGKEYFYFQQDTSYAYAHFATRLLIRCR